MKVIYIGSFFSEDRHQEIKDRSNGFIDNAANNFQQALIYGLTHHYPDIELITLPVIAAYPSYNSINYKSSFVKNIHNIGFLNLPLIKHISKYLNLYNYLSKIKYEEDTTIIIYAIHSPFLKAVFKLKKRNKKIKICLIAPDLPEFMSENKNLFFLFLKKIDNLLINKYLTSIDSFVFLSDKMHEMFEMNSRPWARVEGIFMEEIEKKENGANEIQNIKVILYSGTLAKRYGIGNLLNAFKMITDSNYRLWICGSGDAQDDIIELAKLDSRVSFLGQLTRPEVLGLQEKATVLINPRTSEGEYTKYSFPSKTMEYLASGTPCILNKLEGIPEEYFKYCFIPDDETVRSLYEKIIYVCEINSASLKQFGQSAKTFILENKNPVKQCEKIFKLIETT